MKIRIIKNFLNRLVHFFVSFDVFISVEENDLKYAYKIQKFLRKCGARVFIYKTSIMGGKKWRDEIKENLKDCNYFIALLSSRSLRSDDVKNEMAGAYFMEKDQLLVAIDKINITKLGMLSELHVVNLNNRNFFPNLRKKMYRIYFKRGIVLLIILALIIYSKLKGK